MSEICLLVIDTCTLVVVKGRAVKEKDVGLPQPALYQMSPTFFRTQQEGSVSCNRLFMVFCYILHEMSVLVYMSV